MLNRTQKISLLLQVVPDSSYSDFRGLDVTLEEGMHDYYVTIPQGYNLLLVTTENYVAGNIAISKLRL